MNLSPYDETVDEVLSQYELTPTEIENVKMRIVKEYSPCPWNRARAYSLAHTETALAVNRRSS